MPRVVVPISAALKKFRESRRLSQDDMAQRMKVSRTMYQAYEYGKAEPSTRYVINLALAENVSTDYLLGLSDEPTPAGGAPSQDSKADLINFAIAVNNTVNETLKKLLANGVGADKT